MKTLEEIKAELNEEIPVHYHLPNPEPRLHHADLMKLQALHACSLVYIQALESRLAHAERERDAALKDIANTCWSCRKAKPSQLSKFLYSCPHLKGKAGVRTQCENWQWRGVCPENTKEEPNAD